MIPQGFCSRYFLHGFTEFLVWFCNPCGRAFSKNELSCCRYALDVNVERAEDVLTHKKLLELAQEPANRPVFAVRLVQVKASTAFRSFRQSQMETRLLLLILVHQEQEMLSLLQLTLGKAQDGDSVANSPHLPRFFLVLSSFCMLPMHEITFSTHDKPKLLSLVNQLLSQLYT
ncbi:hypothetical protein B296_00042675, partial [Ensete ventricosum]